MKHQRGLGTRGWGLTSVIVLGALLLTPADGAAQCAMCRRALASPEGQQMIGALRSGILVLLAAPFAVFATIATLAVRRFKQAQPTETEPADY